MNLLRNITKASRPTEKVEDPVTLRVIQSDNYDWQEIFSGQRLGDGREIHVVQVGWDCIIIHADSPSMSPHTSCLVHYQLDNRTKGTIQPDFVLVRNEVRGAIHTQDNRNALFGLMFAGIPCVNSLSSIYNFLERPIVQAELHRIQRALGTEKFPVIPQSYYSSYSNMIMAVHFLLLSKWDMLTLEQERCGSLITMTLKICDPSWP